MGNTRCFCQGRHAGTGHPHACGEHCSPHSARNRGGSSPRLWGTRNCSSASLAHRRPGHPHACGEHDVADVFHVECAGSSPRLWGTRGSIGKALVPVMVHPHACGEHASALIHETSRDRGVIPTPVGNTLSDALCRSIVPRFIPTPVGNTRDHSGLWICCPVHPHACGEHD